MTDPKELKVISTAEVKKHRDKGNGVWIIIHNDIYDVTSFLEEHPGGEDALIDVAGQEATQDFEDVGHSDDARELMKKYLIGTLPPEEKKKSENTNKTGGTLIPADKFNIPPCRSLAPVKSDYKPPTIPRPEGRVNAIYVPRERKREEPPPPRSNLKWAVLALASAVVLGFVLKKYLSK